MDWQLRISDRMDTGVIDVFIFRKVADGRVEYITNLCGECGAEMKSAERGRRMEPCMKLDWQSQQMLQAMADGLHHFGIKATQEPVLKNELTATKYHLSDMRDMVCIVSGIKKGEDFGKDSLIRDAVAERPGMACHPPDK